METLVTSSSALKSAQASFWHGKTVLLTGHTGFKGSWLAIWLKQLGANVVGVALAPNSTPNLFSEASTALGLDSRLLDIRDCDALARQVKQINPDVVFHLAAQALVREGYASPVATYATNVMGTVNLLDALRHCSRVRTIVAVTTDKVYHNREWPHPYRESDALGGHDPYSASKAACEMAIKSYRSSFFAARNVALSSARAGNVIGGGDWSADRLLPDATRAWADGLPVNIRRPSAVRPWQHVLEPLHAYLTLARRTWQQPELAGAYNFGPQLQDTVSVRQVMQLAQPLWPGAQLSFDEAPTGPHEAGMLSLDASKANAILGITPRWGLPEAVSRTISWYADHCQGANAVSLCERDLLAFGALP